MSLLQSNTTAARSRSLRVPAKTALTAPQTASATTTTLLPSSTSNVSLFLTNLRLLDLDLEPDWPGLTLTTFSAKDAAGGQKKRIQCVEWALYQLFTLWDYDETQNKLRPFYPPLDQVQSINLRAALLRGLEQAKKIGVLGRDAVIRKTMLDECKGERFEEVLAVFSSAVLKKLVNERALNSGPEYRPTFSEKIALENWGYSGDRTELNALLLAHKASLRSLLVRKNAARAQYRDFEELLALKERGLLRRKEKIKAEADESIAQTSEQAKAEVYRVIRTNWTGYDQWVDSLLFNDTPSRKGGLLGSRFDDVWNGVQEGRISDLEDQNAGLLEQLDHRVRLQRARLERWDDFRKKMFGHMPPRTSGDAKKKMEPKGTGLAFAAHQHLSVDLVSMANRVALDTPPLEYAKILNGMRFELDAIENPKIPDFSTLLGLSRRGSVINATSLPAKAQPTDAISDISEWEDEPEDQPRPIEHPKKLAKPVEHRLGLALPKPSHDIRGRIPKISLTETTYARKKETASGLPNKPDTSEQKPLSHPQVSTTSQAATEDLANLYVEPLASASNNVVSRDISPTQLSPPKKAIQPMPPPPRPVSPTQALADEILASMSNASPSPMKKHRHTLSLVERTRMSMTRTKSYEKEDDAPQLSPIQSSHAQSSSDNTTSHITETGGEHGEHEDLVARTRRSMVGFEAARQKAQLERRRSQRKSKIVQRKDSHFPKLEEESMHDTSIAEELIESNQEDYEAVFRSRPRIQTSPMPSPTKAWD
ncbi:HAUS augmin-like complex subunit 6 N-terminus-domain-containing protein [Hypoxylon sp. NC1633]|nr:HAUS augmin-like complex subunit 6 N-terminus-domain-containing protein [Hypoxylon sp. NC1633]